MLFPIDRPKKCVAVVGSRNLNASRKCEKAKSWLEKAKAKSKNKKSKKAKGKTKEKTKKKSQKYIKRPFVVVVVVVVVGWVLCFCLVFILPSSQGLSLVEKNMPTPWIAWKKILLSCNHVTSSSSSSVYDPCLISPTHTSNHHPYLLHGKNPKKGSNGSHHSCCNSLKCVVHGNTRVAHRGEEDELGGEVVVVEGEEVDEEIESLLSPQHHHQQHHQYMQLPQCPTLHSGKAERRRKKKCNVKFPVILASLET